jgi:hypothetical protein
MMAAVRSCWALFLGTLLMMLGNGLQGSLLGHLRLARGLPDHADRHPDVGLLCRVPDRRSRQCPPQEPRNPAVLGFVRFLPRGFVRLRRALRLDPAGHDSIWEFYPIAADDATAM